MGPLANTVAAGSIRATTVRQDHLPGIGGGGGVSDQLRSSSELGLGSSSVGGVDGRRLIRFLGVGASSISGTPSVSGSALMAQEEKTHRAEPTAS